MSAKESKYPKDWFKKAKRDLDRVSSRLQDKDIEDAAIHLQQALEKYLKGYLLLKGWKLKPTHDLKELLDEAVKFNPDLEQFYDLCLEVSPYYIEERYPFFIEEPSLKDIEYYFKLAQEFIKKLV